MMPPSRCPTTPILTLLYPALSRAPPAGQRLPTAIADIFPRPGIPSLGGARATAIQSVASGTAVADAGAALLQVVTGHWKRDGVSKKDGTTLPERLWAHWLVESERPGLTEWPVITLMWACERLISADGPSVIRYLVHILPFLCETSGSSVPLKHWALRRFIRRLSAMRGCHRQAPRPVITLPQYLLFLSSLLIEAWLRAAAVICWRRMGRVMDASEIREGGLWVTSGLPPVIAPGERDLVLTVEIPFHKAKPGGSWDTIALVVDGQELDLLRRYLTRKAPTSPPLARPPMFPLLTAARMADALFAVLGKRVGGHVFRRSALRISIEAGVPLQTAILLSLHGNTDAAMAYVLSPDLATMNAMAEASRVLGRDFVMPNTGGLAPP
jgi:hypothetical protein